MIMIASVTGITGVGSLAIHDPKPSSSRPDDSRTALRILDGHVHLLGDGSSGSGCLIYRGGLFRRLQEIFLLRSCGLSPRRVKGSLDIAYVEKLREWIHSSSLDGVVLLAMDYPHDELGIPLRDKAAFYTPNEAVLRLAKECPEFIPAVSIHPARQDALAELEKAAEAGARVVKLLPNVHFVDPARTAYRAFWQLMARYRMILLAHTGGEFALPVLAPRLADPAVLRPVLEAGVRVVAAHCGSRAHPLDKDYTDSWFRLIHDYPNAYGDISALATPDRARTLRMVRDRAPPEQVLHGSDYPIPAMVSGPWVRRMISTRDFWRLRSIRNPLERDYQIKRTAGFPDGVFTGWDALLRGEK